MRSTLFFFLVLLATQAAACEERTTSSPDSSDSLSLASYIAATDSLRSPFLYDLSKPSKTYPLPRVLVEVSGICMAGDSVLYMIEDEKGIVYQLHLATGEAKAKIRFSGGGDYEGITLVEDTIWVLRSDGKLYRFAASSGERAEAKSWKPGFPEGGDYECLAYDSCCGRVLVAAKEPIGVNGPAVRHLRPILHISTDALKSFAVDFELDMRDVARYVRAYPEGLAAMRQSFDPNKKGSFKPSAIAVHPQTGDIYVVASVGKALLVYSREGLLLHVKSLDPDLFPQPEGMCFGRDGTLYIAHEGAGKQARVHAFSPMIP